MSTDEINKWEAIAIGLRYTHAIRFLMTMSIFSLFTCTLWALHLAEKHPDSRLATTVLKFE